MKKLFTFFVLSCSLMLAVGCGSKPSKDNMNEKIQNVFFDTPFGASREDVIRNFAKHGFDVDKDVSTATYISFDPVDTTSNRSSKDYYSFGGLEWKYLSVELKNDKFYGIRFIYSFKDKAAALSLFKDLLSDISKKYNVSEAEPKDTTIYKVQSGYDLQNREIQVYCERDESINGDILYYVQLLYRDINITNEVSDEL